MRAGRHAHEPTLQAALFSSKCADPPAVAGFSTLDTMELNMVCVEVTPDADILYSYTSFSQVSLWPEPQVGSAPANR